MAFIDLNSFAHSNYKIFYYGKVMFMMMLLLYIDKLSIFLYIFLIYFILEEKEKEENN